MLRGEKRRARCETRSTTLQSAAATLAEQLRPYLTLPGAVEARYDGSVTPNASSGMGEGRDTDGNQLDVLGRLLESLKGRHVGPKDQLVEREGMLRRWLSKVPPVEKDGTRHLSAQRYDFVKGLRVRPRCSGGPEGAPLANPPKEADPAKFAPMPSSPTSKRGQAESEP